MANMAFWFSSSNEITLERTLFIHPLVGCELRAIRGKTSGAYRGYNTFQWTPAVQSMCILMLRAAAYSMQEEARISTILTGHDRSAAASLDYSIGKKPCWLLDVFGVDKNGNATARRLFSRSNPEQKRSGPVSVSLNENFLDPKDIHVFINDQPVNNAQKLLSIAEAIERMFYATRSNSQKEQGKRAVRSIASQPTLKRSARETENYASSDAGELACPCCGVHFKVSIASSMAKAA